MIFAASSAKPERTTFSLAVTHMQNFIEKFRGPSFLIRKQRMKFLKAEMDKFLPIPRARTCLCSTRIAGENKYCTCP